MKGSTAWQLYWAADGNPKSGFIITGGTIDKLLAPGECEDLTYDPGDNAMGVSGNYMFKAYQRLGHPGKGELWSEACEIQCLVAVKTAPSADTPSQGEPQEPQAPQAEPVQDTHTGGVLAVVLGAVASLVSDVVGFVQGLF
jgi:hypothetical protein